MTNRGVPLHLMATFLLFKKQQIQGEGGRLRTSHQRSCVLEMVLFETQTSHVEFYSVLMFEQIRKNGEFSLEYSTYIKSVGDVFTRHIL